MINYFMTEEGRLKQYEEAMDGGWISMIAPTQTELMKIADEFEVDEADLKSALDTDERSRIETELNYTMILVNIPTIRNFSDSELYDTIPLSIFVTKRAVITVCLEETPILKAFRKERIKNFNTTMKTRFILQILYRTAFSYLQFLRDIDKQSEMVENRLHKSTQNRELIELLKLEKSLVYFTTSLRSNEVVLEKLIKTENIKKYPEDDDLLEDVIVENKQAIEMANIYSGILSGMMDAFASVISNNLNIVMKVLAIITIVMSIPTMIFSAYGMNVSASGMPFAGSPYGFMIIVVAAFVLSIIGTLILVKLKMFK